MAYAPQKLYNQYNLTSVVSNIDCRLYAAYVMSTFWQCWHTMPDHCYKYIKTKYIVRFLSNCRQSKPFNSRQSSPPGWRQWQALTCLVMSPTSCQWRSVGGNQSQTCGLGDCLMAVLYHTHHPVTNRPQVITNNKNININECQLQWRKVIKQQGHVTNKKWRQVIIATTAQFHSAS